MKKSYIVTAIIGVVIIAAVIGFVITNKKEAPKTKYAANEACQLLTSAEAKEILGANSTVGDKTPTTNSDDLTASACSYISQTATVDQIRNIVLAVRSAKTDKGLADNKAAFNSSMPDDAQMIEGLGEHAFFVQSTGQFDVLSGHNWIRISTGGPDPSQNTVEDATIVARKMIN